MENLKELPEEFEYIWKYFTDLNARRTGTGYGPLSLQYSEILSYFTLYGIAYDAAEVQLIELLDGIAMQHYANQIQKEQAKNKPKSKVR